MGAVHADPAVVAAQAVSIARDGVVTSHDGDAVAVRADTICIHGDSPGAAAFARAIREALAAAGVTVAALDREQEPPSGSSRWASRRCSSRWARRSIRG